MITLDQVEKRYAYRTVISNFSLQIEAKEFVSIVGESGSGKTTLLNFMGALDQPDQGDVTIAGIRNPTGKQLQTLRRFHYGYIFQQYVLMENDTVAQNLLLSKKYNKGFSTKSMEEAMDMVGLPVSFLQKKVYQLSGGEQQRVAIARVMVKPCTIILADEPTGNLDPLNKQIVTDLLRQFQRMGKTVVCVTHDHDVAAQSDRIIRLSKEKGVEI
ncbi:ABC transporter ATP-binding protein [Sinobaca sp. H24]|uniref:ABC transporter ATP-binding protein n=1 Tax=Sinobaca sp. H24 TaxID=2923376 RepID=UPI00207952DA|nr:ABC transporter ATP-binding protein [Sinobaca sp. H24]